MVLDNVTIIVNESINQTTNATIPPPIDYVINTVFPRAADLVLAPMEHGDMLWTLAPMLITLFLMQAYFGRNKDESLGWDDAFGNSVALIFISTSLLQQLYINSGAASVNDFFYSLLQFEEPKVLIILGLFMYGMLLSLISFFHWVPEGVALFIMGTVQINVTAYVVIVLVNSDNIPLDANTLAAGVALFLAVYALSAILKSMIPESKISRLHRLQKLYSIVKAREETLKKKIHSVKTDIIRKVLQTRSNQLHSRVAQLERRIKELERR